MNNNKNLSLQSLHSSGQKCAINKYVSIIYSVSDSGKFYEKKKPGKKIDNPNIEGHERHCSFKWGCSRFFFKVAFAQGSERVKV